MQLDEIEDSCTNQNELVITVQRSAIGMASMFNEITVQSLSIYCQRTVKSTKCDKTGIESSPLIIDDRFQNPKALELLMSVRVLDREMKLIIDIRDQILFLRGNTIGNMKVSL